MRQKLNLFIINNIGGLYSFRKEVVMACINAGHKVVISSPLDEDLYKDFFLEIGCDLVNTTIDPRGMNPIKDIKLLLFYYRLISRIKPDAVLSYTIKPNIYAGLACRIAGVKQIANITGLGDALESNWILKHFLVLLYRAALRKCEVVFFQNASNQQFCLANRIVKGKYYLLPGSGVNLSYFPYSEYPESEIVVFGYVGRIMKQKGMDELFSAIEEIKINYGNKVEFRILGYCDSHYAEQLDKMCRKKFVKFYGASTDVRPFLSEIHCLVHPSYHEGMSNVCLEAAAMGRPVITTDIPGCRETVNDMETGYLVRPKDIDDLVSKIEKFIQIPISDKRKMGVAARDKMEQEFNRQIIVDSYMQELE